MVPPMVPPHHMRQTVEQEGEAMKKKLVALLAALAVIGAIIRIVREWLSR